MQSHNKCLGKPHASAISVQNGDMMYVSKIKVKDIEIRKNNTSENGDNGTCWRQEDGTTEPIRKGGVKRGERENAQKKRKKSRERRKSDKAKKN